jgi:hypothetical protein
MNRLASPPNSSPVPSALDDVLAPPLQSALNSLNVQLDRELARYRSARQGTALPAVPVFKPRQRPLNLISVGARPAGSAAPPPPPNPKLRQPEGTSQAIPPMAATGGAAMGAIVPQPLAEPDDYMASSEALLESLGQAAAPPPAPPLATAPRWPRLLATPLGMGVLLLLLLASGGLGYILVNPSTIAHLAVLWPFGSSSEAPTPETPEAAVSPDPTAGDRAFQGLSPDLSEQEFVRLDLSTLSTLPRSAVRPPSLASTPTTAAVDTPATPSSDTEGETASETTTAAETDRSPAAATATPQPRPAATAAPRSGTAAPAPGPAPAAAPAAPAPTTSTAPNPDIYYVVANYTGDPSLDEARQAVGDAYVRNFSVGARIQLGAFSSQADAEAHAQTLQGQGISAEVYSP